MLFTKLPRQPCCEWEIAEKDYLRALLRILIRHQRPNEVSTTLPMCDKDDLYCYSFKIGIASSLGIFRSDKTNVELFVSPQHHHHDTLAYPLEIGSPVLEQPCRVAAILEGLSRVTIVENSAVHDHGVKTMSAVHSPDYLSFLEHAFTLESENAPETVWVRPQCFPPKVLHHLSPHFGLRKGLYLTDTFTQIFCKTFYAAYWGAQTAISAAAAVRRGATSAYALVRPPGHHAYSNQGGGFCFINNAAIAVRALQEDSKLARVAVLDIDYHHGNGTQEIFYRDSSVLFCSVHGDPSFAYPYVSGTAAEIGADDGVGTTVNFPLPRGSGDAQLLIALDSCANAIAKFGAHALVVSLGFDTAKGDPYGSFCVEQAGFERVGKLVKSINLPTILVQEGGYRIDQLSRYSEGFFLGFLS